MQTGVMAFVCGGVCCSCLMVAWKAQALLLVQIIGLGQVFGEMHFIRQVFIYHDVIVMLLF